MKQIVDSQNEFAVVSNYLVLYKDNNSIYTIHNLQWYDSHCADGHCLRQGQYIMNGRVHTGTNRVHQPHESATRACVLDINLRQSRIQYPDTIAIENNIDLD